MKSEFQFIAPKPPSCRLHQFLILCGPSAGQAVTLMTERFVIGRARGCHLRFSDPQLSQQHCLVERVGDSFRVHDLESRYGTSVNGKVVTARHPVWLRPGDILVVGGTRLRLQLPRGTESLSPKCSLRQSDSDITT